MRLRVNNAAPLYLHFCTYCYRCNIWKPLPLLLSLPLAHHFIFTSTPTSTVSSAAASTTAPLFHHYHSRSHRCIQGRSHHHFHFCSTTFTTAETTASTAAFTTASIAASHQRRCHFLTQICSFVSSQTFGLSLTLFIRHFQRMPLHTSA